MKIKGVKIQNVDLSDKEFVVTYDEDVDALAQSIERVGLLYPPILRESTDGRRYQTVTGYHRVLACKSLGWESIECRCYGQVELDNLTAFEMSIFDNLSIRTFNPVEKSTILKKLIRELNLSENVVIQEYMQLIGLNPHKRVLEDYLTLVDLEAEIKAAIACEKVPIMIAVKLALFKGDDRRALFDLIGELNLGTNKQKELIAYAEEIAKRDGLRIVELLKDKGIEEVLQDDNLSIPQKASKVQWILKKKRYPKLMAAEEEFSKKLESLELDSRIKLSHPPFFEGEDYKVEFTFNSQEELREIVAILNGEALVEKMSGLID